MERGAGLDRCPGHPRRDRLQPLPSTRLAYGDPPRRFGRCHRGYRLSVAETGFDGISLTRRAAVYKDNSQGWTEVLGWFQRYVEAAS